LNNINNIQIIIQYSIHQSIYGLLIWHLGYSSNFICILGSLVRSQINKEFYWKASLFSIFEFETLQEYINISWILVLIQITLLLFVVTCQIQEWWTYFFSTFLLLPKFFLFFFWFLSLSLSSSSYIELIKKGMVWHHV